ncbi:MAG: GDP-mannose 4,6-dehydratase, partial [Thermodesulfobacteriota bacterium]|nr:GDP-mannose 4,6-dehydratase [Thermodesulfobacteriota bacterium]
GTAKYVPIDEEHPLQAQSPYSATKIAADKLAESFHASYDLPIAICRPFNTYGPRQSARAIIPTIISQMIIQKGRIQLGNTDTTRDFNYVTDIVEGFIKIAESEKTIGEVVNIGFGSEISIGRLAQKIAGLCGFELEIVNDIKRIRPPSSEVHRLCANNDKAKDLVGWEPEVDIDKGLVRTTEWFKTNGYKYRQREYNI